MSTALMTTPEDALVNAVKGLPRRFTTARNEVHVYASQYGVDLNYEHINAAGGLTLNFPAEQWLAARSMTGTIVWAMDSTQPTVLSPYGSETLSIQRLLEVLETGVRTIDM